MLSPSARTRRQMSGDGTRRTSSSLENGRGSAIRTQSSFYSTMKLFDYVSTGVFAYEGAKASKQMNLSVAGSSFVAAITALGGGTIRDVVTGRQAFWLEDSTYAFIALSVGALTAMSRSMPTSTSRLLSALAFATFSTIGSTAGMVYNRGFLVVLVLGIIGSCGGGVLGDMLVNGGGASPSVLRRDDTSLLASALGSAVLLSLAKSTFAPSFAMTLTMASIVIVRLHGNLLLDRVRGTLASLGAQLRR